MINQALKIIIDLQKNGYKAYFAGGCVRDRLLGFTPHDIDIVTDATPDIVENIFEKSIPVGKSFGVIKVIIDNIEFDVATFRRDGNYSDGRRPESVYFCSEKDDAMRRDFTINGLFLEPIKNIIIDYVQGQQDLKNGVLKFIGIPEERIKEDRLRILRLVRFFSKLNFSIESETLEAVKRHAPDITRVSAERIGEELIKILRAGNYRKSFDLLFETGLLEHILPEIKVMKGIEQPVDYHPEGDVFNHTLLALEALPENASDELRMAVLLHDVGKPPTQTFEDRIRFSNHELVGKDLSREILKRLKFSNEFTEHVINLVGNHMKFMHVKDMRVSKLKRFMALPKFEEHLALHRVDCLSSHSNLENYEFTKAKFETYEPEEIKIRPDNRILNGNDLLEMGFKQGPVFRTILTDVEDLQLEGALVDREQAVKYVMEKYPKGP